MNVINVKFYKCLDLLALCSHCKLSEEDGDRLSANSGDARQTYLEQDVLSMAIKKSHRDFL